MSQQFYSDARLYDRLFPGGEQAVDFYRTEADRQGGSVLELGCGTGGKLIPIAADGHQCLGLDLSPKHARRGSAQGARARRGGDVVAGRHARLRPGPNLRPRARRRQLVAPSAGGRGPGGLLPVSTTAPGARRAVRLRRVQPERAPARPGRRRSTPARCVVVRGSRSWRRARRCSGDLRRGRAGDPREVVLLDRRRGRLRRRAAGDQEHLPPGAAAAALARRSPGPRTLRRLVPRTVHRRCPAPALPVRIELDREPATDGWVAEAPSLGRWPCDSSVPACPVPAPRRCARR